MMYKHMIHVMIERAIKEVLTESDFSVYHITEVAVKPDGENELHFEYEVFARDLVDMAKVVIQGCGYVSETGVHAVQGAWAVTEVEEW